MSDAPIELKVHIPGQLRKTPSGQRLVADNIQKLADQINEKAQGRRMMGALEPPLDMRTRLKDVSHAVLPTARVKNNELLVDIEILDTAQGRNLKAMLEAGLRATGLLRALGTSIEDVCVGNVDIGGLEVPPPPTVLDRIIDAIDEDSQEED